MPSDQNDLETRIRRLANELEHLKDGMRLLGLGQCSCCDKYFLSSDDKSLFDGGETSEWSRECCAKEFFNATANLSADY
jgi:hypothetical protein